MDTDRSSLIRQLSQLKTKGLLRVVLSLVVLYSFYQLYTTDQQKNDTIDLLKRQKEELTIQSIQDKLTIQNLTQQREIDSLKTAYKMEKAITKLSVSNRSRVANLQKQLDTAISSYDFKRRCQDSLLSHMDRVQTDFFDIKPSDYMFFGVSEDNRKLELQTNLDMIMTYASILEIEEVINKNFVQKKRPQSRIRAKSITHNSSNN